MNLLERCASDTRRIFSARGGIAENVEVSMRPLLPGFARVEESVADCRATLRGFFELPAQLEKPEKARTAVLSARPSVTLLACEARETLGRDVQRGDALRIRGQWYAVQHVLPDGHGGLVCALKEAGQYGWGDA